MKPRQHWTVPLGLAVLAGAWLGPLPALAAEHFAAHMTMHVAVVAVAAPLLAIGVAGRRLDPVRRWPAPFHPLLVSTVELFVVWAWHAPALHHLSRHHAGAMAVEQGSFLLVGVALWLAAFGGAPQQRLQRRVAGIGGLLMTSMHMTLLGVLLALAPRALYGHDELEDQQRGGVLMLAAGGSSYLAGGLYLLAGLLRPGPRQAGADGPASDDPTATHRCLHAGDVR